MPGILRLDSIVFETADLPRIRAFSADVLALAVGSYERDGKLVPDENDTYVNFECGTALIGFELSTSGAVQTGSLVLKVPDIAFAIARLAERGLSATAQRDSWAKFRDPDGRELIVEQA
jgi:catechol 2,3-dioxygenase-like lactoylglutathione lyase family enzyme